MTRVMPSDKRYPAIAELMHYLGAAMNPQCFYDVRQIPELERGAYITDLEDLLDALLGDVPPGAFIDYFDSE